MQNFDLNFLPFPFRSDSDRSRLLHQGQGVLPRVRDPLVRRHRGEDVLLLLHAVHQRPSRPGQQLYRVLFTPPRPLCSGRRRPMAGLLHHHLPFVLAAAERRPASVPLPRKHTAIVVVVVVTVVVVVAGIRPQTTEQLGQDLEEPTEEA